ncbi:MAG: cytochrome c [Gammaproteobacteria bacterium]|nr:cytochrome c [Gammaproteobacteria bacterium]
MKACAASALSLALLPAMVWAGVQEPPSGAELYAAHCTRCHGTEVHVRPQRLVNTLAELRARIQQCELTAELGWFEEEVDAVVKYLNDAYYRFPEIK